MPKAKLTDSARLRGFVQDFGEEYFSTYDVILFYKSGVGSLLVVLCRSNVAEPLSVPT
jgi:hypothetical protein